MAGWDDIKKDVRSCQRLLKFAGYDPGKADGLMGQYTQGAIKSWDEEHAWRRKQFVAVDDRSEKNLETLLPAVASKMHQLLLSANSKLAERGYKGRFKIICGTRSYKEQDALYTKRPKVTNARGGCSMHNFGLAADFCLFVDGRDVWDGKEYDMLGDCARKLGLEWGGDWKSLVDKPHVQVAGLKTTGLVRVAFEAGKSHWEEVVRG